MFIFQLIKCFICPVVAKKPNHRTLAWPIIYHSSQSGHNVGVACNTALLWTHNTMILSRWTDGLWYSWMSRTAVNGVIPTCSSSIIQLPRSNNLSTYIFDLFHFLNELEFHLTHPSSRSCISADDPCLIFVVVTRPHNIMLYFGLLPRNAGESGYNARTMSITLASTLSRKRYMSQMTHWIFPSMSPSPFFLQIIFS